MKAKGSRNDQIHNPRVFCCDGNLCSSRSGSRFGHEFFHHQPRPRRWSKSRWAGGCRCPLPATCRAGKTWRAYLSTNDENARDRIGSGPWYNAKGDVVAMNVDELHSDANKIDKQTGLTETGEPVKGRGDEPNMHDILTGSTPEGTVAAGQTCGDWTSNGDGTAIVGHHDRIGLRDDAPSKSWNSSHPSRGCGKDDLPKSGGNGLFYCFARN